MNHALLSRDTDSTHGSKSKATSSGLSVNQPGDSFEREADRVAETVSSGGRLPCWSLAMAGSGGIQRQSAAIGTQPGQTAPASDNYGEAFLQTKIGQDMIRHFTDDNPLIEAATDFFETPAGIAVAGTAAIGVIATLASAHAPLPAQIPAIPLGKISSRLNGLKLKITYEGPVNRPTTGMLALSFEGKSPKKKDRQADSKRYRADTARMAAEQEKFRAGLQPKTGPAVDQHGAEDKRFINWSIGRVGTLPGMVPLVRGMTPQVPAAPPARPGTPETGLRLPPLEPHFKPKAPSLLDKKLELKPVTSPAATPDTDVKKREEIPVQRKAESSAEVFADSAEVNATLRASGRALEPETRRYMESRIGFDFSKVRVHTDARAAASARSLGARAYTVGSSVVFGAGRYAPQTTEGRRLLAHELTHVVQQSSPPHRPHPIVHSAPRQVQRLWGLDLPDAKAWLLGKLRDLKGYPLFCVVIGVDLITGKQVERNATNLTQGVLGLFDGGPAIFERLKKAAGALETAYQWVLAQIAQLGLNEQYFSELLDRALKTIQLTALIDSWERVKAILSEPLDKLIEFASRLAKAALDFILEAALEVFPAGKQVYGILKKAGSVISRIASDPVPFAKNLLDAVKKGFSNFGMNIVQHLGDGLKKWIFEEINLPDLKMPEKFDFASIVHLVLQVLKLTYDQRRPQLVEKLGEPAVYFFETAANVLTRIKKEGFVAVWQMIKEQASNLFDSVIDAARDWAITQIVKLGLAHVAALATPIGDAIEIIKSIYETINFFIEKASKFVALVDSVVNSFADMVEGKIDAAANKVESTMANSIPLILKFLADQIGLSGIGESIRKIITNIRKPIDDAIGKVLDLIVDKAKPLWEKGKAAFTEHLSNIREWWTKPRKFSHAGEDHTLTLEGDPDHPEVIVHSRDTPLGQYLDDVHASPEQKIAIKAAAKKLKWRKGELHKPDAADEKGNANFNELKNLMDNLDSVKERPKSEPVYGPLNGLKCGVEASAFLSSNHDPGTKPDTYDPPIMKLLGPLRKKDSYVKGHLLSMRLGGKGQWTNMMPITNKANQQMEGAVEGKLIAAIGKGKKFYHYTVRAEYDDTPLPDTATPEEAKSRMKKLSWTVAPASIDPSTKRLKKVEGEKPRDENDKVMTFSRESVDPTITSS